MFVELEPVSGETRKVVIDLYSITGVVTHSNQWGNDYAEILPLCINVTVDEARRIQTWINLHRNPVVKCTDLISDERVRAYFGEPDPDPVVDTPTDRMIVVHDPIDLDELLAV